MAAEHPEVGPEIEDSTTLVLDITLGDEHRAPSGEWKLSAALLSVTCPAREGLGVETLDDLPNILGIALRAWNESVVPEIATAIPMSWMLDDPAPAVTEHLERVAAVIRQLKAELHPSDRRVIVHLDIDTDAAGAPRLVARGVSVPSPTGG